MKLGLVRHAQSKTNAGHTSHEDSELTNVSLEQARRLGKYFHKIKLDKIYCGALKRVKATLDAIKPYVKRNWFESIKLIKDVK